MSDESTRTWRGAATGLAIGMLCSAIATASAFLKGFQWRTGEPMELTAIIATYLVVGPLSGAIVGRWNRPSITMRRRLLLSAALGPLMSIATSIALLGNPAAWNARVWAAVCMLTALVIGVLAVSWKQWFGARHE